jgi:hypothetical protein
MARWTSFLGSGKTVAATTSQVITFTGNDLPSAGVVAYHFVWQGATAGNAVADISRIRVKADNRQIFDVSLTHFRKWLERFSQNGYALPTTELRFSIPFNLMDIVDDDLADVCQFPRGAVPTVEITTGSGTVAGNLYAGWTQTDQAPQFYSQLIGQQMNISGGATNATFPITTAGAIRGAILDTANLGRLKMELNGFAYHQLIGSNYLNIAGQTIGDMTLAASDTEDGAANGGSAVITTQAGLRVPMIVASSGASRIELDTGSSWSTSNELTLWTVHNQN